jgi:putative transposase
MPRRAQVAVGGFVYHVLNRGAKRTRLFFCDDDYAAFEMILLAAQCRFEMGVLAYCLMPNHWHFLLRPRSTRQLSEFMHWLTMTHVRRWQTFHQTIGTGAVYQGRYKAIPVQTEKYFLNVCRYVERNAARAGLVRQAQEWRWSSLWRREHGAIECLEPWPVAVPANWRDLVNGVEDGTTLVPIRAAITRGSPLGDPGWAAQAADVLGLKSTLRSPGRPKKAPGAVSIKKAPGAV